MKNRFFTALITVACLALTSCSSMFTGGLTKSEIPFQEVPPPDEETVIIYVYRMKSMVGAAGLWAVRLDGEVVANLSQDAYVVLYTTPGEHSVTLGDASSGAMLEGFFGFGALGSALHPAADQAEMAWQAELGELPDQQAGTPSSDPQDRVYWFRSKGFGVDYVSRAEALPEIVHMKYEPNSTEKAKDGVHD